MNATAVVPDRTVNAIPVAVDEGAVPETLDVATPTAVAENSPPVAENATVVLANDYSDRTPPSATVAVCAVCESLL